MQVVVKENSPVLINNNEHKNFVETDKIVPLGTTLNGEFVQIKGLRRGKEFVYRLFKDQDGIFVYEKNVEPMYENETRVVDMPSVKGRTLTTAFISAGAGVIAFAVAKKMQKTNKQAFIIAGITALVGYGVASMLKNSDPVVISNK